MTTPSIDEEARANARWLIDLIQVAMVHYPHLLNAIALAARAFVTEERRRVLIERLARLDAREIEQLETVVAQFERNRSEDPPPPLGTVG